MLEEYFDLFDKNEKTTDKDFKILKRFINNLESEELLNKKRLLENTKRYLEIRGNHKSNNRMIIIFKYISILIYIVESDYDDCYMSEIYDLLDVSEKYYDSAVKGILNIFKILEYRIV